MPYGEKGFGQIVKDSFTWGKDQGNTDLEKRRGCNWLNACVQKVFQTLCAEQTIPNKTLSKRGAIFVQAEETVPVEANKPVGVSQNTFLCQRQKPSRATQFVGGAVVHTMTPFSAYKTQICLIQSGL